MSDDYQRYDPSAPKPPIHRPTPIEGVLLTVVGILVVAIVIILASAWRHRRSTSSVEVPPEATPPAPRPPPCIHETCADRPRFLKCASSYVGIGNCVQVEILYERHCDCDTWGTVSADGGAP